MKSISVAKTDQQVILKTAIREHHSIYRHGHLEFLYEDRGPLSHVYKSTNVFLYKLIFLYGFDIYDIYDIF